MLPATRVVMPPPGRLLPKRTAGLVCGATKLLVEAWEAKVLELVVEAAATIKLLELLLSDEEIADGAGPARDEIPVPPLDEGPAKGEPRLTAEPTAEDAPPARPPPAEDTLALPPPVAEEPPKAEDTDCSQSLPRGWSSMVSTRGDMCPRASS